MSKSRSASRTKPRRDRGETLEIKVYPTPELLLRFEDALHKAGRQTNRSGMICSLMDEYAKESGF